MSKKSSHYCLAGNKSHFNTQEVIFSILYVRIFHHTPYLVINILFLFFPLLVVSFALVFYFDGVRIVGVVLRIVLHISRCIYPQYVILQPLCFLLLLNAFDALVELFGELEHFDII